MEKKAPLDRSLLSFCFPKAKEGEGREKKKGRRTSWPYSDSEDAQEKGRGGKKEGGSKRKGGKKMFERAFTFLSMTEEEGGETRVPCTEKEGGERRREGEKRGRMGFIECRVKGGQNGRR